MQSLTNEELWKRGEMHYILLKYSGVNVVNVTGELQLRICCSIKKKTNSLYYSTLEHFSCSLSERKTQACLNFILRWGVCLVIFLSIFLSFLIVFLFLPPLTGETAAGCTGHQKKCLDALKSNFLKIPPRLMHFSLAIANSFCSPLPSSSQLVSFQSIFCKILF